MGTNKRVAIGSSSSADICLPGSLSAAAAAALPLGPSACETPRQTHIGRLLQLPFETSGKVVMMKKFKGLIFDFNGVLLLDQQWHDEIWRGLGKQITGRDITEAELKEYLHGKSNKGIFDYLLGKELAPDELEERARQKELAYQKLAVQQGGAYRLAPGAIELLEALKRKSVPFTIGTSSPQMNLKFFNDMLGLDQWFDMEKIVCTSGDVRGKPYPDIYLKAAEKITLPPGECVVIEDAKSGIAAAHAAGIGHIIAIGPKESHEFLATLSGVNEVIENLTNVRVEELF